MGELSESIELLIECATKAFFKQYNSYPDICSYAPGRVNLIGEHIDYNDGFVLPMAIPLGTLIVGKRTEGPFCHILTLSKEADEPKFVVFPVPTADNPLSRSKPLWTNYVKGVISNFSGTVYPFDAVIVSSVPVGGGLSSSAALEVATYCFLEALKSDSPHENLKKKALACQKAEHEFALMPCGIMDQFISFMGKANYALLIDCRSLETELVPLNDPDVVILITNSNVRHELTGSEYPSRRKCCEDALKLIGKKSMRDVTLFDLEDNKDKMTKEMYRRVRHVIGEIQRTQDAAKALIDNDYEYFGELMVQSHRSLRDDYEVSCSEIDQLVDIALETDGVFGSRITGGGFGGCTVTLVRKDSITKVMEKIKKQFNGSPTFYICSPSEGAQQILLEA